MKNRLSNCPVCGTTLEITRYHCPKCQTAVEGHFKGCSFCKLSDDERLFTLVFLQTEGNMKDVERAMGISYPTIKARLARVNEALADEQPDLGKIKESIRQVEPAQTVTDPGTRRSILDRLASGEITAREASSLLRGETQTTRTISGGDTND
jgi:hypothetical protein